jgi:hypothetical protein
MPCAMLAAVEIPVLFRAMADDGTAAMGTRGGEGLNGAFEAVERVAFSIQHNLKCFLVLVAAGFTGFAHTLLNRKDHAMEERFHNRGF